MRCYYEVLNIARDAEEADIKTAYKKLALRWHPDKNLSNPDEAKEQFQLVQQAYEVLSDRQERAWYDNHREQILHGSNKEFEDNCLDVFQYFTSSCYKGFGNDDTGFYTVYRNLFEQLAKEDMEHMDNKNEFTTIPMFGNADSDYEAVVRPFYAYWMSYSTKRSYVWLDPYDIKETRDRRVVKLIEKENKKVRAKAKKERNDEVRNLVAFVRKRDKRVQANVKFLEQKAKENKQRAEELALQARRERRAESKKEVQAEWSKFDNVQEELANIEKQLAEEFDDEDVSEEEIDDLYCVACNKVFKTPKAFANHESSKKHKENIEKLREEMLEEDEEFETIEDEELSNDGINDEESSDSSPVITNLNNGVSDLDELDLSDINSDELEELIETKSSKKKSKKNKQNKSILTVTSDSEPVDLVEIETSRSTRKTRRKNNQTVNNSQVNGVTNDEPETGQDGDCQDNQDEKTDKQNTLTELTEDQEVQDDVSEVDSTTMQKKSKRRKDKKNNPGPSVVKSVKQLTSVEGIDIEHTCVSCNQVFVSKNKLFDHLKKTGHGVYIDPKIKVKDNKDKSRSKKGKREERRKRADDSD